MFDDGGCAVPLANTELSTFVQVFCLPPNDLRGVFEFHRVFITVETLDFRPGKARHAPGKADPRNTSASYDSAYNL